jgi:hypothetical protein
VTGDSDHVGARHVVVARSGVGLARASAVRVLLAVELVFLTAK